jgi:hypothetical protein
MVTAGIFPFKGNSAGIFPFKGNSHGRAGNRTRDLMITSQRLWPLDHEAGHTYKKYVERSQPKKERKEGRKNMREIEVFWYFTSGWLVISFQFSEGSTSLILGSSGLFLESLTFELYSVIYMNAI